MYLTFKPIRYLWSYLSHKTSVSLPTCLIVRELVLRTVEVCNVCTNFGTKSLPLIAKVASMLVIVIQTWKSKLPDKLIYTLTSLTSGIHFHLEKHLNIVFIIIHIALFTNSKNLLVQKNTLHFYCNCIATGYLHIIPQIIFYIKLLYEPTSSISKLFKITFFI